MTNASAPLWFYCRQTGYVIDLEAKNSTLNAPYCSHCETGMVFAINPTAAMSFSAFQAAAKNSNSNGAPAPAPAPANAASGSSPSTFASLLAVGGVFSSLLLLPPTIL